MHPVLWCSLACSGSTEIYGPFDSHRKHILWVLVFLFFKGASEVLKLIAQLILKVTSMNPENTLFSIQFLNQFFFFTMLQWTALVSVQKKNLYLVKI